MKKNSLKILSTTLVFLGSVTACASESKLSGSALKIDESSREVAQADQVIEVERPESLKSDTPAAKKHKEYLRYIERHDKR